MSLITQCPACATMFKVVPDQLRVSEGWVRCGQCDEVFDANAHLQPTIATPEAAPPVEPVAPSDYDWDQVAGVQPAVPAPDLQGPDAMGTEPAVGDAPGQPPVDHAIDAAVDDSPPSVLSAPDSAQNVPVADPFLEKSPQELSAFLDSQPPARALFNDANAALPPADSPREPPPSFLARASAKSGRRARVLRGCMALGCVMLSLVLVVQFLLHERNRIAVMQPALAPLVAALCSVGGCQIEAFRDIDALVIDSSSFAKASAQTYRLQFTLKNVGPVTVATPALELALTDTQDHTLVRRVVRATEFGNRQGTLGPGDEVTATLPLQVKLASGSEKIAGYRLLAFYP